MEWLVRHPKMTVWLTSLELHGGYLDGDEICGWLKSSPHMNNLTCLRLCEVKVGSVGCKQLVDRFVKLRELEVSDVRNEALSVLTSGSNRNNLTSLYLNFGHVGEDKVGSEVRVEFSDSLANLKHLSLCYWYGCKEISFTSPLVNLEYLDLSCNSNTKIHAGSNICNLTFLNLSENDIDDKSCLQIIQNNLPKLTHLDLSKTRIGNVALNSLTSNPKFSNISHLNLSETAITHVKSLSSPTLSNLTNLNMDGLEIGSNGCHFLTLGKFKLTALSMCQGQIGDEGLCILSKCPHMSNLKKLHLSHNQISSVGCEWLVNSPYVSNLTDLRLDGNSVGNEGCRLLANSCNMDKMTDLNLSKNGITNEGCEYIANSVHLFNLTSIHILGSDISDGILRKSNLPNLCHINVSQYF